MSHNFENVFEEITSMDIELKSDIDNSIRDEEENINVKSPESGSSKTDGLFLIDPVYSESTKIILENLIQNVIENKAMLIKLQKSVDLILSVACGEHIPEIDFSQPANSLKEFLAIEEYIKIKWNYNELVVIMGKIGGKTVEATTRKIWNKLCTTTLAAKICWTGANGKHCLRNMKLNNAVRDAVLMTHANAKECDIQRATMLWFSHAQDRLRLKSKKN
ncbi:uncharacterized protein [Onthophagus taurus]|uniref:uncharacterized protein n=1 Tax=Onthophagus taurus TaxID=166361 RepID=UPI000C206BCD|nr:uncharacterized protein LOC111425076 [Onthophagus taurus]